MGAAPRKIVSEPTPDWGGVSTDTLVAAVRHGDEITRFPARPGEREKPPKRLSGLDWLWSKGRITITQMGAGLKYGDDYRIATDVSLASSANLMRAGGDGTTSQQNRMEAEDRLKETRCRALNGHSELIVLCDKVAGEGLRVRDLAMGIDTVAIEKEAKLVVALDHLASFYGMIPT